MDLNKFFANHFGSNVHLTQHVAQRISERLTLNEMNNLELLLKNVLRGLSLGNLPSGFIVSDEKMGYHLICDKTVNANHEVIIHIITFIRGDLKTSEREFLRGSIKKEQHQAEIDMLRAYKKQLETV